MAVAVASLAISMAILAGIGTDALRLGPGSYALPADALRLWTVVREVGEDDATNDYYSLIVFIENGVEDRSVRPYQLHAKLVLGSGQTFIGYWPLGSEYYDEPLRVETGSSDPMILTFPTGRVEVDRSFAFGVLEWNVRGEAGLRSESIFESRTNLWVERIRVPEGASPAFTLTVTLVWYYRTPIQAYPIADQRVTDSA